jgi:hypothetical protein
MSAQLPRRSTPPGSAAAPGHSVFRSKIAIATQRQHDRACLLAQVDKSRESFVDKSRDISRAAPTTPSSIERVHRLLQRSVMKKVNVPIRASTLSPILDLLEFITKLPPTVVALPPTDKDVALPPTVEKVPVVNCTKWGGGGSGDLNQGTAPSTPPSTAAKAAQGQTLDDNNNPYYCCAAHQLCQSIGDHITNPNMECINIYW